MPLIASVILCLMSALLNFSSAFLGLPYKEILFIYNINKHYVICTYVLSLNTFRYILNWFELSKKEPPRFTAARVITITSNKRNKRMLHNS